MPALEIIPLDQIDAPTEMLRASVSSAEVQALARSIEELGLLQPIGVVAAGERFRLVFGNRRLLAHKWLGRRTIEARVLSAEAAAELASSVAENVARRDLSTVEEARACRGMIDGKGMSVREVAEALSRSESWVRVRLDLLLWGDEVVDAVGRGDLPLSVARELMGCEEADVRAHYLRCALESGCTAAQMRMWVSEWEVRRAPGGVATVPFDMSSQPPIAQLPVVGCAVCHGVIPVTEVRGLRVCAGCADELVRVTAEGRKGRPAEDGEDGG